MFLSSAGFTYSYIIDRLKHGFSIFKGTRDKVYDIFDTVIGHPFLCCHDALHSLINPSVIFLARLYSIQNIAECLTPLIILALF
jgi:hypothetical protein